MADRPNILLITSDQHRSECLGCAGHPAIQTPHLDQLAFEGVRFTNAYTDCPICIPGRTTLVTGIQSHIYGMPSYAAANAGTKTGKSRNNVAIDAGRLGYRCMGSTVIE